MECFQMQILKIKSIMPLVTLPFRLRTLAVVVVPREEVECLLTLSNPIQMRMLQTLFKMKLLRSPWSMISTSDLLVNLMPSNFES
jgi:hypothetical protein